MLLYIIFLIISISLCLTLNIVFVDVATSHILISCLIYFVIEVIIDAILAISIHKIPSKYIKPNSKIYKVYKWEKKFYEFIGIKKWKNKIPDLGALCDFKKDKLYNPNDSKYLYKFIEESCYGETIHLLSVILSFLILLIPNNILVFTMALPMSLINVILNLLPALVQRYVRPRLLSIYNMKIKK